MSTNFFVVEKRGDRMEEKTELNDMEQLRRKLKEKKEEDKKMYEEIEERLEMQRAGLVEEPIGIFFGLFRKRCPNCREKLQEDVYSSKYSVIVYNILGIIVGTVGINLSMKV